MIFYAYSDLHMEVGDTIDFQFYGISMCYEKINRYYFKSDYGDSFDIDKRGCVLYLDNFKSEITRIYVIKQYVCGHYTIVKENDILRHNRTII